MKILICGRDVTDLVIPHHISGKSLLSGEEALSGSNFPPIPRIKTRKRLIKLLMAKGKRRNAAVAKARVYGLLGFTHEAAFLDQLLGGRNLRIMLWFSQRKDLAKAFEKWADENGAAKTPLNVISWLVGCDMINEDKAVALLEKADNGGDSTCKV